MEQIKQFLTPKGVAIIVGCVVVFALLDYFLGSGILPFIGEQAREINE